LSTPAYETVPVACPNCNNRFVSPVLTIIDVGQNPDAKTLFLSGQLNIAVCPQCGHAGMLSTPIVYHDPEQELLFTYLPPELGLPESEQQRIIGDMTNHLMSVLPAEQRKGYLLRPRSFLRLEGMIEAVLEADGITSEMLEAQRAKTTLLNRLLHASSDDARQLIAQENEDQIDYEFFQILTLNIELAQANGQAETVQQLLGLRKQLLDWTSAGREVAAREEAIKELGTKVTREGLLEKLVDAALAGEQAKVETMVAMARPAIDYIFYQELTGRIETAQQAGNTQEAGTLKALRQSILDLTAEIDAEVQRAREAAIQLLQKILQSDDLEKAVLANLDQIDDLFMSALAMNLQTAEQTGQSADVEKLRQVSEIIMGLIQESQPPEIQFINRLLTAEYPDGTQALLDENHEQVNAQLLEIMRLVAEDLEQSGREQVAQHLAQIREQAAAMVG
jgi:hypothetical protein